MLATFVPLVVILTVILQFWVMFEVGRARKRTGLKAPATTGAPEFERAFRVQMNTLEQTMMFLPSLWLCVQFANPDIAAVLGMLWIVGRVIYAVTYYRDPAKRGLGFILALLANALLLAAAIWGWGVRALS